MTSGRLDVAEDDFRKVGYGGGSKIDFGSCEFLKEALGKLDMCHHHYRCTPLPHLLEFVKEKSGKRRY